MEYRNEIKLRDNQECIIRNAVYDDGPEVTELFEQTHGESDYLLSYPEENSFDAQGESEFLQKRAESNREVMLVWNLVEIRWDSYRNIRESRN